MKKLGFLLLLTFFALLSTNAAKNTETVADTAKVIQAQTDTSSNVLTSDQIFALKQMQMENEKQKIEMENRSDMPLNNFSIVLICMLPFLFVISLIFVISRHKAKESQKKYDLYLKAIEMGQTIPENFFEEPETKSKASNLQKGMILLMIGLALTISYFITSFNGTPFIVGGLITGFLGLGFLLVHFIEKPKNTAENQINE